MSADRWSACPICKRKAEAVQKELQEGVESAYGKLSRVEWEQRRDEAYKPIELEDTMREDYEIGITDRDTHLEYYAIYSCSCEVCGFEFNDNREQKIESKETERQEDKA
jgi:hypothetical protein